MFLDTGLVTLDPRGNQPAGGIRRDALENWDVVFADGFTESVIVSIGPASRHVSSFSVFQDGRNLANLGDTTPDVLISHGFFKHYVWTMDFDERKLYLRPVTPGEVVASGEASSHMSADEGSRVSHHGGRHDTGLPSWLQGGLGRCGGTALRRGDRATLVASRERRPLGSLRDYLGVTGCWTVCGTLRRGRPVGS